MSDAMFFSLLRDPGRVIGREAACLSGFRDWQLACGDRRQLIAIPLARIGAGGQSRCPP